MIDREENIIRYLQGELHGEELSQFELELDNDANLRQEVTELMLLENHIQSRDSINQAMNVLNDVHREVKDNKVKIAVLNKIGLNWKYLLPIFFIITVLLALLYWYTSENIAELSDEAIYASYYKPDNANFQSKGTKVQDFLTTAQISFNQGNYEESRKSFELYLQANPEASPDIFFYYGIALIGTDQNESGRKVLSSFLANESIYKNEAQYYIGLSLLQDGKRKEAIETLKQIDPKSSKYQLSREIIKKIQ